jgi:colicin import membrane protein
MTLTESQKRGVIATAVFHTAALLLFLYFGFITPFPPLPDGGILLDFGNSETGIGMEEPSAGRQAEKQSVEVKNEAAPKVVSKPQSRSKINDNREENLLTQDYEQAIALNTTTKKRIENDKKVKLEEERLLREKADKQKRLEDIENKRLAEEKRIKEEETAKKIGSINTRAKNAFGGGKTENGSQSQGQGVTYGPGNQGSPDGTPGANQYGLGGGTGNGTGNGTSFSLAGRSARSLPKPNFPGNEAGVVVVEVTVNKFGKVTDALPGIKGSTTMDSELLEAARKAAISASFNSDANAPAFQKGTITYHFVLQ